MKSFYEVKNTSFSVWLCFKKMQQLILFWDIAKISWILYGFYFDSSVTQKNEKWIVGPLGQAIKQA